ncbi:MAG: GTP 3',8-cyclase MoaA, partial [Litorimonas sp.]
RCQYCMSEKMTFLPKADLLSLEELAEISHRFIDFGVEKIRISGGEPLVRKDVMELFAQLSPRLGQDLSELTLTTNGTQLSKYADRLTSLGVQRINLSLDSLNPDIFAKLTRRNVLPQVMEGIRAAKEAGLQIKINTVLLPQNLAEIPDMMRWAHAQNFDMSLIEIMPMGQTDISRRKQYVPMTAAKELLAEHFDLSPILNKDTLGGPARYSHVAETGGRIGFISPLTNNFCAGCNRVRLTCTGRIYMCLGQEDHIDLRKTLREGGNMDTEIARAVNLKPEAHDFSISDTPSLARHMSVTGG